MSWIAVLALAVGSFALKAVGPLVLGERELGPRATRGLALVAVPLLAALIMVQTFGAGQRLVLDARAPALVVAAVCVWRGAPFLVTVLAAAATAAGLRVL